MRKLKYIIVSFLLIGQLLLAQRPALIPFRKGHSWGYCDSTKKIKIITIYKRAFPFVNSKAIVETTDRKVKQIDSLGNVVLTFSFSMNDYLAEYGWMRISSLGKERRMGILSIDGKLILAAKYEEIEVLGPDSFEVVLSKKKGVINSKGKTLVKFIPSDPEDMVMPPHMKPKDLCPEPCIYKPFTEHMAVAVHHSLFGFANEKNEIAIPCKYFLAESFLHGLAWVTFEAPGQEKKENYKKDGVEYAAVTYLQNGFIDKYGTEYWED